MTAPSPCIAYLQQLAASSEYEGAVPSAVLDTTAVDQVPHAVRLAVPCAGMPQEWTVVFAATSGRESKTVPDVVLPEGSELDVDYGALIAVRSWDPEDANSLLLLVNELRALYLTQQRSAACAYAHDRFSFEMEMVREMEGVEVCLHPRTDDSWVEATVLVPLSVDLLPYVDAKDVEAVAADPAAHTPQLRVQYRLFDNGNLSARASIRARGCWKQQLDSISLTPWGQDDSIVSYKAQIEEELMRQIPYMSQSSVLREQLMAAFLADPQISACVLEADVSSHRYLSFLIKHGRYSFAVQIALTAMFPQERPSVMFQSIGHVMPNQMGPVTRVFNHYQYNPTWSVEVIVAQIKQHIVDTTPQFIRVITG